MDWRIYFKIGHSGMELVDSQELFTSRATLRFKRFMVHNQVEIGIGYGNYMDII